MPAVLFLSGLLMYRRRIQATESVRNALRNQAREMISR
jgi:hypothetical protein